MTTIDNPTSTRPATSTSTALIDQLRAELHDVNPDIAIDLAADRHLIDELGVDSLDLIEFVARIEYEHGFLVPDDDIDRLVTLDAIVAYMTEALGAG